MRLIYICEECGCYIDEIEMEKLDETRLGFDVLTSEEKEDLVHLDRSRQVGTVMVICDQCWRKKDSGEYIIRGIH